MGGGASEKEVDEIVQEVREVLSRGGFQLKVVTRSGVDPDPKASKDGVSVGVGGYRWSTKEDRMGLGMGEINFHRKVRGIQPPNPIPVDSCVSGRPGISLASTT